MSSPRSPAARAAAAATSNAGFERGYSLRVRTSQQLPASGFAAQVDQQETIAMLDLKLVTAMAGRNYGGK